MCLVARTMARVDPLSDDPSFLRVFVGFDLVQREQKVSVCSAFDESAPRSDRDERYARAVP